MTERAPRAECLRCRRPAAHCLCGAIPRLAPRTELLVLQHPRERRHPVGTARFVELGLGARVLCPVHADRSLACAPVAADGAAVLYPSERARDLAELAPSERPRTLVVIDGTWHHARSLRAANPWLAALPEVRITPRAPSRYRIRREPERHYLSTVEAVVEALGALEPGLEGLEGLLAAFDQMVEAQLDIAASAARAPRRRDGARRGARGLPRALFEGYDDLVLVYAEWAEPPGARGARVPRAALQWAAYRPATGACFERCVAPARAEDAARGEALGLLHGPLAGDEAEALAALGGFVGARGTIATWDRAPLLRLANELPAGAAGGLALRDAYRTLRGRTGGALEDVLAREGAAPRRLPLAGRAGERLGNAAALVALLRALTLRAPSEAPALG